jgi:hypothetical protein
MRSDLEKMKMEREREREIWLFSSCVRAQSLRVSLISYFCDGLVVVVVKPLAPSVLELFAQNIIARVA